MSSMAEFVRQDVIKGANFFKGSIDGEQIDSGSIHIEQPLDTARGTAAGYRTVAFSCPNSDISRSLIESVKSWPVTAEVRYAIKASAKAKDLVVVGVRVVGDARPQPQPTRAAA